MSHGALGNCPGAHMALVPKLFSCPVVLSPTYPAALWSKCPVSSTPIVLSCPGAHMPLMAVVQVPTSPGAPGKEVYITGHLEDRWASGQLGTKEMDECGICGHLDWALGTWYPHISSIPPLGLNRQNRQKINHIIMSISEDNYMTSLGP